MSKDRDLLGVNPATANYQLQRRILFMLARQLGKLGCFQCGRDIVDVTELSIEHKEAWRSAPDPKATFFDLENIAFSHTRCNSAAAAKPNRRYRTEAGRKTAYSRRNRDHWNRYRREQRKTSEVS